MTLQNELEERYQHVLARIEAAAKKSNRDPSDIQLVVVTKGHPTSTSEILYDLGIRHFGESRVEASYEKIMALSDKKDINWHMIGHIQSRKAQAVCENFDFVHSVDSIKLARRLNNFAEAQHKTLPILLQCNTSGEGAKSGWSAQSDDLWHALVPEVEQIAAMPGLAVQGLMTMAPHSTTPENARPYFARLKSLRDFFAEQLPACNWQHLSMGMSGDYEVAVQEGATLIRVGSAILKSSE